MENVRYSYFCKEFCQTCQCLLAVSMAHSISVWVRLGRRSKHLLPEIFLQFRQVLLAALNGTVLVHHFVA